MVAVSHSKISALLQCPRAFRYRYIDHVAVPTAGPLVLGSAYHAALAHYYGEKLRKGEAPPRDHCLDAFGSEWARRIEAEDIDWGEDTPQSVRELGERLVTNYLTSPLADAAPAEVESSFSVAIPGLDEWTLDGVIDLVTVDGVVIDHKTANRMPSANGADNDLQASAYAFALMRDPVIEQVRFEWHVATRGGRVERLSTVRTREDADWYVQLLHEAIGIINAGVFPPNPTSYLCGPRYCYYYERCRAERFGKGGQE